MNFGVHQLNKMQESIAANRLKQFNKDSPVVSESSSEDDDGNVKSKSVRRVSFVEH